VTYPGFTPVGNATLVVANVLTCNKHSPKTSAVTTRSSSYLALTNSRAEQQVLICKDQAPLVCVII
jgi:hypothetical protein